ncbi:nitrate/nitrite transporter NrtS [Methylobacterium marchantiae]|uniref:Nitrate/nitrite transporter NrtS n=1 Tax=Methylobacterium marchantiae TaxID=600331 RepID=A0ABW3WXP9_9HYPH
MMSEPHQKGWRLVLFYAVNNGVPARSLKVAVVVGTVLNLINQGDALFGDAAINWTKVLFTFAMPYAVSTYGAVAAQWDGRHKTSN